MRREPLVTLAGFPGIIGCPGVGVLRISDTNPVVVLSGIDCGNPTGCTGTELRILPELTAASTPPIAFTGLECLISEGMDNLLYDLHTAPACMSAPLNVTAASEGILLTWAGDGFRAQGAENLLGPWYDLGADSPVTLPANVNLRVFRLLCD
jgi:hypothetical protein